jgi:hypothetical protein
VALFGAAVGVALLGKYNGYVVVLLSCLVFAWTLRGSVASWAGRAGLAAGIALLVAGPWLLHNVLTYGDPFGVRVTVDLMRDAAARFPPDVRSELGIPDGSRAAIRHGYTYRSLLRGDWGTDTVASFVGNFGWMKRPLRPWQYRVVYGLGWSSLIGGAVLAARCLRRRRWPQDSLFLAMSAVSVVAVFFMTLDHSLRMDYQPQGRYLFPAISGIALPFGFGLTALGGTSRGRLLVAVVALAAFACVTAAAYLLAVCT